MRHVTFDITPVYQVRQLVLAAAVVHLEAQSPESLQQDICSKKVISAGQTDTGMPARQLQVQMSMSGECSCQQDSVCMVALHKMVALWH